jgi:hypothetical protein
MTSMSLSTSLKEVTRGYDGLWHCHEAEVYTPRMPTMMEIIALMTISDANSGSSHTN